MAVVYNGTLNKLPAGQLPDGYVRPTVTIVTPVTYVTVNRKISINKVTVEDANPITTMDAIIAEIASKLTEELNVTYISNDVTGYGVMNTLTSNYTPELGDDAWLKDIAPVYLAEVTMYIKVLYA